MTTQTDPRTRRVQGIRTSGAAGKHAPRHNRRARTRAAAQARALKEQGR